MRAENFNASVSNFCANTRNRAKLPTNSRFLAYELMQRGILKKRNDTGARRGDQNLHDALTHLREKGIIPWDWISDETRSVSVNIGWSSVAKWATTMVEHVRLDPWAGRAPFVLTESRSLSGVLDNLARQYRVRLAATNGQCGGFLHTDNPETKRQLVMLRSFEKGVLMRDVSAERVEFLRWESIGSLSRFAPPPIEPGFGCKWFGMLCGRWSTSVP